MNPPVGEAMGWWSVATTSRSERVFARRRNLPGRGAAAGWAEASV